MLRRVVLALSNIPREVRQDELTDIKLQTATPSQSRPLSALRKAQNTSPCSRLCAVAVVPKSCRELPGCWREEALRIR